MTKAKSSGGGFAKVRKLITVLEKCNGKNSLDMKNALISPGVIKGLIVVGLLVLVGALFTAFYLLEPLIAPVLPVTGIVQSLMLIMLLLCFVLSVKNIVTVLYSADDLPVLLPMPFSAGQIVTAKLAVASKFAVGLSLVVINSVCLGLGIRAGLGVSFIIGTVLSGVLIPVTGVSIAALLVVIVFRVFGFIRNRDITVLLGGLFTLALTVTYIFVYNQFDNSNGEAAAAAFSAIASVSSAFPNVSFMSDFMFESSAVGLLVSVLITAAVAALAMLAVKLFYISTALSMQTTGGRKKAVSRDSLSSGKSNAKKALTSYEAKTTRRNPAYMIYGFAMSFIWPVLMVLPMLLGNNSFMAGFVTPLHPTAAILCALSVGVTASCFACGFNVLAVTAFSREGSSLDALRALPISLCDYYKSKRNFALLICSLGSVLYTAVLGIVCAVTGVLAPESLWVIPYSALISFLLNLILIDCMLLKDSRKPYTTWDSETEISRKLSWINVVAIIVGVAALIGFLIALVYSTVLNTAGDAIDGGAFTTVTAILAVALPVVIIAAAIGVDRFTVKQIEKNLNAIE